MSAYDAIRDAISLAIEHKQTDLVQKLIGLQSNVLETQDKYLKLQEENTILKEEIKDLKALRVREQDVEENPDHPYITFRSDQNKTKYCANCWHKNNRKRRFNAHGFGWYIECPECKTRVSGEASGLPEPDFSGMHG